MSIKIGQNLVTENLPVIRSTKFKGQVFTCKEFNKELSSITGIYSKFLYIPKINQLSGGVETPVVTIICGEECKVKCINLKCNK